MLERRHTPTHAATFVIAGPAVPGGVDSRQALVNAFQELRDATRKAVANELDLLAALIADYARAISPDSAASVFAFLAGADPGLPSFGSDASWLEEVLSGLSDANTESNVGIVLSNIIRQITTDMSVDQARQTIRKELARHFTISPVNGTRVFTGTDQLLKEIDSVFNEHTSTLALPDPLPTGYPVAATIDLLKLQSAQILASSVREVSVQDGWAGANSFFELGALAGDRLLMKRLVSRFGLESTVVLDMVAAETGAPAGASAIKIAMLLTGPFERAAEATFWGGLAPTFEILGTLGELDGASQLSTKAELALLAAHSANQLLSDLRVLYQILTDAGNGIVQELTRAHQHGLPAAGVLHTPLTIVSISTPDIALTSNATSGTGRGSAIIHNGESIPLVVTAFGKVSSLLNGSLPAILGLFAPDATVVVPPGGCGTLTFRFTAFQSALVDASGYQLNLTARGSDANGGSLTFSAPFVSTFFTGTPTQLPTLRAQSFAAVESGDLAPGTRVSLPITTRATTVKLRLTLNVADGSECDLHLYDASNNHTGFDDETDQPEADIPGSSYSGAGAFPQWIVVDQAPGSRGYTVEVVSLTAAGGTGYSVSLSEMPALPAILGAPATLSLAGGWRGGPVSLRVPIKESGGFASIVNFSAAIGSLVDEWGHSIPSTSISLRAPPVVPAGSSTWVTGTIAYGVSLPPGTYSGTLSFSGNDGETNASVVGQTSVRFRIVVQETFLPIVVG